MKTPKDRARDGKRSPMSELDKRRAHLAAGGTVGSYDRSHYADQAPEGFYNQTPETLDEIDRMAESAHLNMKDDGKENLLDKSTYSKPPF